MGTALKIQKWLDPEPYDDNWLPEDSAWLRLTQTPWAVTPQLLFAMKAHIVVRAQQEGYMYADSPEEARGLDLGY